MKKKIVIGLTIYTVVLLLAGIYIIYTIHASTADLNRLIRLHEVEILRENYLIQIKRVQSDLTLMESSHPRSVGTVINNVTDMGKLIDSCFGCHHSAQGTEQLANLKMQTDRYKNALSGILATRSVVSRRVAEEDAFRIGETLIDQTRDMIALTSSRLSEKTQKAMGDIGRTQYLLYGIVGLGPLLSALMGYIFISGMTRPLDALLASTRKLKAGDLDHRVRDLQDEFGELAVSFNEMAVSLKDQMRKMQHTEQMVVVGELAAGLAHEIKNPLAGIKVAMQVLVEEDGISEEDRHVVRRVSQEVVRLESLMKNFLNFAKPAKPQLAELNVNSMINTILAFYVKSRPISEEFPNAICITKELHPLPNTMADPMQLQQVFLNLVLNAVDAMPNGGVLHVRTVYDTGPAHISIEISDTGKGISPEHSEKIFQPFFTTKPKGTGLGLAISKQLIEQHGGSITAAGNPSGGTIFGIQLPLKTPPGEMTT
ncbi:MAG: ATP-binding protein [Deltaproteobacteria bacterium]|nr:ATP-binding protein [Candidatus Deferrimicrobiaceae bacterium]